MKKETIKIKVDQTKLPNKIHFEIQKKYKASVVRPKKGKGSFKRNKKECEWIISILIENQAQNIYHN